MPQLVYPDGATPLDPDELDGLRHPHVSTRQQLNELEQANVQAGLDWLKRRRRSDLLTEEFLRLLHLRLFGKVWRWAGGFRTTEKNIGVDPAQIQFNFADSSTIRDTGFNIMSIDRRRRPFDSITASSTFIRSRTVTVVMPASPPTHS